MTTASAAVRATLGEHRVTINLHAYGAHAADVERVRALMGKLQSTKSVQIMRNEARGISRACGIPGWGVQEYVTPRECIFLS